MIEGRNFKGYDEFKNSVKEDRQFINIIREITKNTKLGRKVMIKYYDMSMITKRIRDATKVSLDDIMNKNNYIYDTEEFEYRFKRFTGVKYCIGVSSGTAALHLALKAIGIKKDDLVASVSHTFRATGGRNKICKCQTYIR